jgi:putative intracellular protease/amidase
MDIGILLYDGFTALDAIGPYEVLSRLPGAEVTFLAARPGPVRTDTGRLALVADQAIGDRDRLDVLVVPGGPDNGAVRGDEALLARLRAVHETTTWTTSVCTGSLILAAAGLLAGRRATSHWLALDELARLGATPARERVVFDGRIVTAAGVSAGIDMALTLAARIAGEQHAQAIQLMIEYDPRPPFRAGSPDQASPALVAHLRSHAADLLAR